MATDFVVRNLKNVLQSVAEISAQQKVRLVAVSKTFPADLVWACYQEGGHRHFGENYVQELEAKARDLTARGATDIRWHYIGRLQSNTVKRLCSLPNLWCVETVDSRKHSDAMQAALQAVGRTTALNVFIQVNTSGEANKGGVQPDELVPLAKHILERCPTLSLMGLMTIGSISESLADGQQNADFALLRRLRDEAERELQRPGLELSMGMSADYALAIKYGSTNVRVGSHIFGQRQYGEKQS